MTQGKRVRKILLIVAGLLFVVLAGVATYFGVSTLIKRKKMYKECSVIEEYKTREIVSDPDDYNLDINKLLINLSVQDNSKYKDEYLYIFEDGSIAMGRVVGEDDRCEHHYEIIDWDNNTYWNSVDLIYFGKMSGQDLYHLLVLRDKANFEADYYDAEVEYNRQHIIEPSPIKALEYYDVDPWISAIYFDNEKEYYFFTQAADGIRHYLYDKNAQQMLHNIEDSWYFDQWMTEIYGEDWQSIVTIYRTEDDFVIPVN